MTSQALDKLQTHARRALRRRWGMGLNLLYLGADGLTSTLQESLFHGSEMSTSHQVWGPCCGQRRRLHTRGRASAAFSELRR